MADEVKGRGKRSKVWCGRSEGPAGQPQDQEVSSLVRRRVAATVAHDRTQQNLEMVLHRKAETGIRQPIRASGKVRSVRVVKAEKHALDGVS